VQVHCQDVPADFFNKIRYNFLITNKRKNKMNELMQNLKKELDLTEDESNSKIFIVGKIENLVSKESKRHTLAEAYRIGKRLAGRYGHCQLSMSKHIGHLYHLAWIYTDKIYV